MIRRNSSEERINFAKEIQKAYLLNPEKVRAGVQRCIVNPYILLQSAEDWESFFVGSGLLTHEEFILFQESEEQEEQDETGEG